MDWLFDLYCTVYADSAYCQAGAISSNPGIENIQGRVASPTLKHSTNSERTAYGDALSFQKAGSGDVARLADDRRG